MTPNELTVGDRILSVLPNRDTRDVQPVEHKFPGTGVSTFTTEPGGDVPNMLMVQLPRVGTGLVTVDCQILSGPPRSRFLEGAHGVTEVSLVVPDGAVIVGSDASQAVPIPAGNWRVRITDEVITGRTTITFQCWPAKPRPINVLLVDPEFDPVP